MNVPEIRRRNRMSPGAKLSLPALSADVQSPAEDLVDVPDGVGHMIGLGLPRGTL